MIFLTRKAEFSAAHFYWIDSLSPEENFRIFGKCSNRNGHGHNYTLEVTVAGEVDPITGFVVDLKQLKDILENEVVGVYDHRHLNLEIEDFRTAMPTAENIAIAVWRRLAGKIPNASLHRVRIYEMPDLFADFYGEFDADLNAPNPLSSFRGAAEGSASSAASPTPRQGTDA
jgi:6-pyruvoyltetrahydropterin/6-carboxytetrahydropterin synthase